VAISEVLFAKVTGDKTVLIRSGALGFPLADLLAMDLEVLCRVLVSLAERICVVENGNYKHKSTTDVAALLPRVGSLFANWPDNFIEFCATWHNAKGRRSPIFQVRFQWLFVKLHKNFKKRKDQTLFLIEACLQYGLRHWDKKPIVLRDAAFKRLALPEARFGTYETVAKSQGVSRRTATRWIKRLRIPGLVLPGRPKRVDLDIVRNLQFGPPKAIQGSHAARQLGLSEPVFDDLRKTNTIRRISIGRRYQVSTAQELDEFKTRLMSRADLKPPQDAVSLLDLGKSRFFSVKEKAQLFRDIAGGKVEVFSRRRPSSLRDLLVSRGHVHSMLEHQDQVVGHLGGSRMMCRFGLNSVEARAMTFMAPARTARAAARCTAVEKFLSAHQPLRLVALELGVSALWLRNLLKRMPGHTALVLLRTGIPSEPRIGFVKKQAIQVVRQTARKELRRA
jgi:hypothetical protein